VSGRTGEFWWTVVDAERHPLGVWQCERRWPASYAARGRGLSAVVVTNGPLMGKHLLMQREATKPNVVAELGLLATIGALLGALVSRRRSKTGWGAAVSCLVAITIGWWHCFTGWQPCGGVTGRRVTGSRTTFAGEGPRHAWIGRRDLPFASYAIGQGDLPDDLIEGLGGLIRVVRHGDVPETEWHDHDRDPELARMAEKRGVVAWALVPLGEGQEPVGVLVVVGSAHRTALEAGRLLQRLGARDAVATDLRRCAYLRVGGYDLVGPPPFSRQGIQHYGLYCGT
jgi:hypothetical protein